LLLLLLRLVTFGGVFYGYTKKTRRQLRFDFQLLRLREQGMAGFLGQWEYEYHHDEDSTAEPS